MTRGQVPLPRGPANSSGPFSLVERPLIRRQAVRGARETESDARSTVGRGRPHRVGAQDVQEAGSEVRLTSRAPASSRVCEAQRSATAQGKGSAESRALAKQRPLAHRTQTTMIEDSVAPGAQSSDRYPDHRAYIASQRALSACSREFARLGDAIIDGLGAVPSAED